MVKCNKCKYRKTCKDFIKNDVCIVEYALAYQKLVDRMMEMDNQ